MTGWIWITWEKHRRTRELCRDLCVPLFEKDLRAPRIVKHPFLMLWTVFTLAKARPHGLFIQNPSIVLSFWAILLRPVFRYTLVVDAHNAALELSGEHSTLIDGMRRFVQKAADLTLVTNSVLAERVNANRGRAFILPDRLPDFPAVHPKRLSGARNVVCVTRFAEDEPYLQIIEATALLGPDIHVHMTGNSRSVTHHLPSPLPSNLTLTGFVPEDEYLSLLAGADVILDLTNRPDCLVCGAYEAVTLGQPLILSDTPALRRYFSRGCVYTDHSPPHIAAAVQDALHRVEELRVDIAHLRDQLSADWQDTRAALLTALTAMTCTG